MSEIVYSYNFPEKIYRLCKNCNSLVTTYPSHDNKYCSKDCMSEDYADGKLTKENNPRWEGGQIDKRCINCGEIFQVWPKRKNAKYCSRDCMSKDYKGKRTGEDHPNYDSYEVECDFCGEKMIRKKVIFESNKHFFCDTECQGKWISNNKTGENAYNWQGGSERHYGSSWLKKRRVALERDDYKCRVCGKGSEEIGRNPSVHHIKPVAYFDDSEQSNKLDNLISLCPSHHHKVEGWNVVPTNILD